jgi:UMF1 family MFS transporter
LDIVLFCWMGTFLLAAFTGIFALPLLTLYVVACAAGISLGGTWAADRPYMLRLAPPSRIGEFYGLYGMVGRFSAISGPAAWALILYLAVRQFGLQPQVGQGVGVLVLLVQMVVSYFILRRVSDYRRDRSTQPPGVLQEAL